MEDRVTQPEHSNPGFVLKMLDFLKVDRISETLTYSFVIRNNLSLVLIGYSKKV